MFSVHAAASLFYYLGTEPTEESVATLFDFGANETKGRGGDYYALPDSDPLSLPALWTGRFASTLGYPPGSKVSRGSLAALWHGLDPRDGKTPLNPSWPSLSAQLAAQSRLAKAESAFLAARRAFDQKLVELTSPKTTRPLASIQLKRSEEHANLAKANANLKRAQRDKNHRQTAHDCTFSAPKGVSLLWARLKADGANGDSDAARAASDLERAMQESVQACIDHYIEPQLLFTRHGSSGNRRYENAHGIAAALFSHFDARPVGGAMPDPQMHVHALLMSMALDHDQEAQALWTTFLSEYAPAIGAAFRAELAHRLRGLGYDLRASDQEKVRAFDLAGADEAVNRQFSARGRQIRERIAKGADAETAALGTRASKGNYSGADLLKSWRERLDSLRLSAESLGKGAGRLLSLARNEAEMELRKRGLRSSDPSWMERAQAQTQIAHSRLVGKAASVDEAVDELLSKRSSITLKDIDRIAFEAAQFCEPSEGKSSMDWAREFKIKILLRGGLTVLSDTDRFGRPQFTSRELQANDRRLHEELIPSLLKPSSSALEESSIQRAILDFQAQKTQESGQATPFALHPYQKEMVHDICRNHSRLHVVLAPAGCGKTTSARAAAMAFEAEDHRVVAVAPSNSAAKQLAIDLGKDASEGWSVHSLLARLDSGKLKLLSSDVILCDESSMLDAETAYRLVEAVSRAEGGPARIIFMGDTEQLPSVGRGNFFRKLVSHLQSLEKTGSVGSLTQTVKSLADWERISRQRSDYGKQATTLFALGQANEALAIYERLGALRLHSTKDEALEELAADAMGSIVREAREHWEAQSEWSSLQDPELAQALRSAAQSRNPSPSSSPLDPESLVSSLDPGMHNQARAWLQAQIRIDSSRAKLDKALSQTLMIATKRADVTRLNELARASLFHYGALKDERFMPKGSVGQLPVAIGERVRFAAEARLAYAIDPSGSSTRSKPQRVPKSSAGTIVSIESDPSRPEHLKLRIRLDGAAGATVEIHTHEFSDLDHAYAITAHSAQGATVDRVFEYLSDFASSETSYVAKSRHRDQLSLYGEQATYELHRDRSSHAAVKLDTMDHTPLQLLVEASEEQWAALDGSHAESRDALASLGERDRSSLRRRLVQGRIVSKGRSTPPGSHGSPCFYVDLDNGLRVKRYFGDDLEALLAGMGEDDHVGLEHFSHESPTSQARWRVHGQSALEAAGVFQGVDWGDVPSSAINRLNIDVRSHIKSAISSFDEDVINLMALKDAVLSVSSHVAEISAEQASTASTIILPERWDAALERSTEVLRILDLPAAASLALSKPIQSRSGAFMDPKLLRQWLGFDGMAAYCLTGGEIEAWPLESLPDDQRSVILKGRDLRQTVTSSTPVAPPIQREEAWLAQTESAWSSIHAKLRSPWGLALLQALKEIHFHPPIGDRSALANFVGQASSSIRRWSDPAFNAPGSPPCWMLLSNTDPRTSQPAVDGSRFMRTIVAHLDDSHAYVISPQGIMAVPRSLVEQIDEQDRQLSRPGDAVILKFDASGSPSLINYFIPKVFGRELDLLGNPNTPLDTSAPVGRIAAQIMADLKKSSSAANARQTNDSALQAYAEAKAQEMIELSEQRAADLKVPKATGALPIEALSGATELRRLKIAHIGTDSVLFQRDSDFFTIDKNHLFQALGGLNISAGKRIPTLHLESSTTTEGLMQLNSQLTQQAQEQGRSRQ